MKGLIYSGLGLAALWLQLALVPLISLAGYKPNLLLVVLLVLVLRWTDPWSFCFAALVGLGHDAFSHGVLGVYGISFFLVSFLARFASTSLFDKSTGFVMLAVMALSLAEGLISVTLFQILDSSVPWWAWMFGEVLPVAVYNGLLAPLIWLAVSPLNQRLSTVEI